MYFRRYRSRIHKVEKCVEVIAIGTVIAKRIMDTIKLPWPFHDPDLFQW